MKDLLMKFKVLLNKQVKITDDNKKEIDTEKITGGVTNEREDCFGYCSFTIDSEHEEKLEKLYQQIMLEIIKNYKNLFNLFRSSIIIYFFLGVDDLATIKKLTSSSIKSMFTIKNIAKRLFNCSTCIIDFNILEYHPLIIENVDKKEILIRQLCNKIALASRIDTFNKFKFIDYFKAIEDSLNQVNNDEIIPIPKIRKNTTRGGIRKKLKKLKKIKNKNIKS